MRLQIAALALALIAQPASAETVAIVGAKVWSGADVALEDATIVITDGRIVSIGSGTTNADRTPDRTIDARGKVVTLPLDAAATQIGLMEVSAAGDTDDRAVTAGPLGAAFDVSLALDPASLTIQLARAQGVGRAMSFPGSGNGIFAGLGARIDLGRGDIAGQPRAALFAAVGGSAGDAAGGSRAGTWGQLRNALDEARARGGGGLLNKLDLAAVQRVIRGEVPLALLTNRESDIRQAIALARDYGIRVVIVGGAEAWRAAPELAAAKIPVVLDPLDDLPTSFDTVGARRENAAILARAGVTIAFSVSAQAIYLNYNVGPGLREGAGIAAANGLSYASALRAITLGAGQIWGGPAPILTAGSSANLVVWDGDPLEPASAPVAVFMDGCEVSLVTRQTRLRDRYRPARP